MDGFSWSLLAAAAGIALTHTLLGPDHYLPFVMLSRARAWGPSRTLLITTACGAGHVLSSLVLGLGGLALGAGMARLQEIEAVRGDLAAWALVATGVAWFIWGVRRGVRQVRGLEVHAHGPHVHVHPGSKHEHAHPAGDLEAGAARPDGAFWVLFAVFVLGPCEPMIPLFVLPASRGRWGLAAASAILFGIITIATMAAVTSLSMAGMRRIRFEFLDRWSHALAGAVLGLSGGAILALGL